VHNTCDPAQADLPVFDHEMLMLEHRVAEPKNHRRVFDELEAKWLQAFAACTDLPAQPDPATVETLLSAAWGGRRYRLRCSRRRTTAGSGEMEAIVIARLGA
jgi:hypothetical protein